MVRDTIVSSMMRGRTIKESALDLSDGGWSLHSGTMTTKSSIR